MDYSMPGSPILHYLPEFAQIHVHWVSDAIWPSHTMSNLTWFMDLTFQDPIQYYSLKHRTLLSPPDTSTTAHRFHFGHFILSLVSICPLLFPSSILDTFQLGRLIFHCHVFWPFHIVHEVLAARILELFAILSSSGLHFIRTLHYDLSIFGGHEGYGS